MICCCCKRYASAKYSTHSSPTPTFRDVCSTDTILASWVENLLYSLGDIIVVAVYMHIFTFKLYFQFFTYLAVLYFSLEVPYFGLVRGLSLVKVLHCQHMMSSSSLEGKIIANVHDSTIKLCLITLANKIIVHFEEWYSNPWCYNQLKYFENLFLSFYNDLINFWALLIKMWLVAMETIVKQIFLNTLAVWDLTGLILCWSR